ncbi:MAG: DUF2844 domain-containing protein [Formivibrio sp.]|nr:DUF2844 domain-containing protein [Formivibrio sp.]
MKTFLAIVLFIACGSSQAGLGSTPANLGQQVIATKENPMSTGSSSYTYLEKTLDSGTAVHEYVAADGAVFAVSWSGPYLPDLKEILGAHFDTMVAQSGKQARAGRSPLFLQRDDVVIVSAGHMGAFEGKAWIPGKLPAGFKPNDIK